MSEPADDDRDWQRWQAPLVGTRRSGPAAGQARQESSSDSSGEPVTAAEIESLQEQAWSEAWEKGHEKGYEEGRKAGKKDVDKELSRIRQVLKQLSAPLDDLDEQVEQELVELAVAIARQVIYRELRTDPGQIVAVVRESLQALPAGQRRIEVQLHPEDAELVREQVGDSEDGRWSLVEDASLKRGGCIVSDSNSRVDARLEQQVGRVVAEVLGEQREAETTEPGDAGPDEAVEPTSAAEAPRGEESPDGSGESSAPGDPGEDSGIGEESADPAGESATPTDRREQDHGETD